MCVNYDLNGSLRINGRPHARLNNQPSLLSDPSIPHGTSWDPLLGCPTPIWNLIWDISWSARVLGLPGPVRVPGSLIDWSPWLESLSRVPNWDPWLGAKLSWSSLGFLIGIPDWSPQLRFLFGSLFPNRGPFVISACSPWLKVPYCGRWLDP